MLYQLIMLLIGFSVAYLIIKKNPPSKHQGMKKN